MKLVEPDISFNCDLVTSVINSLITDGYANFDNWEVISQEVNELKLIKLYSVIEFQDNDGITKSQIRVMKDSWLVEHYEDLMELIL